MRLARIASADLGRKKVAEDARTQGVALALLGKAALQLDEPERAELFLRAHLELEPDPLSRPYIYYHLAECRRRLGDAVGGCEFDNQAASSGFGTLWERLARERLEADVATT